MAWRGSVRGAVLACFGSGVLTSCALVQDHESVGQATQPAGAETGTSSADKADVCGDGVVGSSEQCDDGNRAAQDGCGASCLLEMGFACNVPGQPCTLPVCGNGVLEAPAETCDDGNRTPDDGCDATCQIAFDYVCGQPGKPCTRATCGNGVVESKLEGCDDGNAVSYDGCDAFCTIEPGYLCPQAGESCILAACGNKVVEAPVESCDDGNQVSGDGCDALCGLESGYVANTPGLASTRAVCGNGRSESPVESCDDGNTVAGDGCSAQCQVEANALCDATGTTCAPVACGNRKYEPPLEDCDDGNQKDGDGCSANCQVEPGYVCDPSAANLKCWQPVCGDGVFEAQVEQCDDGNMVSGDGCSQTCYREGSYICDRPGQPCRAPVCGDGMTQLDFERCDDGNQVPGDGCSAACVVEAGWACPLSGGVCHATTCGDGVPEGYEGCDDANAIAGDGCSGCQVDTSWACEGSPSVCSLRPRGDVCSNPLVLASGRYSLDGMTPGVSSIGYGPDVAFSFSHAADEAVDVMILPDFDAVLEVTDSTCSATQGYGWYNSANVAQWIYLRDLPNLAPSGLRLIVAAWPAATTTGTFTLDVARRTIACGDAVLDAARGEGCDDGNQVAGDGCSAQCAVESGWQCDNQGAPCRLRACGNGTIDYLTDEMSAWEECDDGNQASGDGCTTHCKLEGTNVVCPTPGQPCRKVTCGDGIVDNYGASASYEECDDGNNVPKDGCTACRLD